MFANALDFLKPQGDLEKQMLDCFAPTLSFLFSSITFWIYSQDIQASWALSNFGEKAIAPRWLLYCILGDTFHGGTKKKTLPYSAKIVFCPLILLLSCPPSGYFHPFSWFKLPPICLRFSRLYLWSCLSKDDNVYLSIACFHLGAHAFCLSSGTLGFPYFQFLYNFRCTRNIWEDTDVVVS